MMKKTTILGLVLVLLAVLVVVSPAMAQDPQPTPAATPSDDEVNAIAKNMFCPVCENTPLDVCGTVACGEWREEIGEKLMLGWTEEEIYDYFQLKFGDRVLAKPPREGFNWVLYLTPPAAILIGAYFLLKMYLTDRDKNKKVVVVPTEEKNEGIDDDVMTRLQSELDKRDE